MNTSSNPELEQFFVPFARRDDEKRIVSGYAYTSPRVKGDRYNLKRSALEKAAARYMEMPCIRSMHQPIAAGKALSVKFDDKGAFIEAFISDDVEWKKVQDGVYRGFSILGNPLIARGFDIEEFDWIETSLVDRPKDAGALFSVMRVEDSMAGAATIELPEDATDEEIEIARLEIAASSPTPVDETPETDALVTEMPAEDALETDIAADGEASVARAYNAAQPRDEAGMWSVIRGHRVSTTGAKVTEEHVHEAVKRFNLDAGAQKKLLQAHASGKIENDHHLFRAIAHATDAHDTENGITTGSHQPGPWHWDEAIKAHGKGGTHEGKRNWGAPHQSDYKHLTDRELATHLHDKLAASPQKTHKDLVKGDRVIHEGKLVEVTHVTQRQNKANTVKAKHVDPDSLQVQEKHGTFALPHTVADALSGSSQAAFHVPTQAVLGAAAEMRRRKNAPVQRGEVARDEIATGEDMSTHVDLARGMTSDTAPARENLEGDDDPALSSLALCNRCGKPYGDGEACQHCGAMHEKGDPEPVERSDDSEDENSIEAAIGGFVGLLWDAYDGPDTESTILAAISTAQASAQAILSGERSVPAEAIQRLATLEIDNSQLIQRVQLAESELESVRRQSEDEISTVRSSTESALSRLEEATGTVSRLETQTRELTAEIEELRAAPLKRSEARQTGSVALARSFAANEVLAANDDAARRSALEARAGDLKASAALETDPVKREAIVGRLLSVEYQINNF